MFIKLPAVRALRVGKTSMELNIYAGNVSSMCIGNAPKEVVAASLTHRVSTIRRAVPAASCSAND